MNTTKSAYAYKRGRKHIKTQYQSGGALTSIAECVIDGGGVVYGVTEDCEEHCFAVYKKIAEKRELDRIAGSKYVQALLKPYIFRSIEKDLASGKIVLFTGTPCYIRSVQMYLSVKGTAMERLITAEFLCHGVISPGLLEKFVKRLEAKHGRPCTSVRFRDIRVDGWGV